MNPNFIPVTSLQDGRQVFVHLTEPFWIWIESTPYPFALDNFVKYHHSHITKEIKLTIAEGEEIERLLKCL